MKIIILAPVLIAGQILYPKFIRQKLYQIRLEVEFSVLPILGNFYYFSLFVPKTIHGSTVFLMLHIMLLLKGRIYIFSQKKSIPVILMFEKCYRNSTFFTTDKFRHVIIFIDMKPLVLKKKTKKKQYNKEEKSPQKPKLFSSNNFQFSQFF